MDENLKYQQGMDIPVEIVEKARIDLQRAEAAEKRAQGVLENAREERLRIYHFLEQCDRYAAEHARQEGRSTNTSQTSVLIDAAIEVIMETGPLGIGDLHDALIARGLKIGGQKPKSNLAGFLSRGSASGANIEYEDGVGWRTKDAKPSPKAADIKPVSEEVGNVPAPVPRNSPPRQAMNVIPRETPRFSDLDDEIPF